MLQRPTGNRVSSWWHLKQRTDRLRRIWKLTLLRSPLKKRTLKKAGLTSPKCSPVSTTTTHDPATGTRWAMPKHSGTGHSVYSPTGDRRFPPPWSILVQPLSERQRNVRRAAAIFSFSLHPLAKKISAKKLLHPA